MVAAGVLVAASCGGDGGNDVFSFAEHDLCEWVSEADVAEWVAAEFDWEGTATEVASTDEFVACEWTLASGETDDGAVIAGDATLWRDFDDNVYDFAARMAREGVTEYPPPEGRVGIGAWVVGHPAVSDGVVVHNGGFGQFAFGVPPGPWLQLSDPLHADVDWDDGVASAEYEARYFAVADHFLRELGWVPPAG